MAGFFILCHFFCHSSGYDHCGKIRQILSKETLRPWVKYRPIQIIQTMGHRYFFTMDMLAAYCLFCLVKDFLRERRHAWFAGIAYFLALWVLYKTPYVFSNFVVFTNSLYFCLDKSAFPPSSQIMEASYFTTA